MAVSFDGTCYATPSDASDAFLAQFPRYVYSVGSATEFNVTSYVKTSTGIIYNMKHTDALTMAVTTYPQDTLNFNACTVANLSPYPMQDMVFYFVLVILFALGFQAGQHR